MSWMTLSKLLNRPGPQIPYLCNEGIRLEQMYKVPSSTNILSQSNSQSGRNGFVVVFNK